MVHAGKELAKGKNLLISIMICVFHCVMQASCTFYVMISSPFIKTQIIKIVILECFLILNKYMLISDTRTGKYLP